jgi:hypothetical protein
MFGGQRYSKASIGDLMMCGKSPIASEKYVPVMNIKIND